MSGWNRTHVTLSSCAIRDLRGGGGRGAERRRERRRRAREVEEEGEEKEDRKVTIRERD